MISDISQRGWVQCVCPVFHVMRKRTRGRKTMWNGPKRDRNWWDIFFTDKLLLTGASRQLDVWDFWSSLANGWQQRQLTWVHCCSIRSQLILKPQRVQAGHSPTQQSPAWHADKDKCLRLALKSFAIFMLPLLFWSNFFCRLRSECLDPSFNFAKDTFNVVSNQWRYHKLKTENTLHS